jgi:general secretion pathway protein N
MLTGLGSPWNTLQLTGELSLSTDNLAGTWSRANGFEQMTGQASLQVSNVTTALSTVKPLGSYRVISAGADIRLETIGGADNNAAALILAGSGQILQGRVSFTGEAVAARGFEDALSNLLHIVGQWQPSADGRSRSVLKL